MFPYKSNIDNFARFVNSFFSRRRKMFFQTGPQRLFGCGPWQKLSFPDRYSLLKTRSGVNYSPHYPSQQIAAIRLKTSFPRTRACAHIYMRCRNAVFSIGAVRTDRRKKEGCACAQPFFLFVVPVLFFHSRLIRFMKSVPQNKNPAWFYQAGF